MIVRAILVLACSISGYFIAYYMLAATNSYAIFQAIVGFIIGLIVALLVIRVEKDIRKLSLRINLKVGCGILILGIFVIKVVDYLSELPMDCRKLKLIRLQMRNL